MAQNKCMPYLFFLLLLFSGEYECLLQSWQVNVCVKVLPVAHWCRIIAPPLIYIAVLPRVLWETYNSQANQGRLYLCTFRLPHLNMNTSIHIWRPIWYQNTGSWWVSREKDNDVMFISFYWHWLFYCNNFLSTPCLSSVDKPHMQTIIMDLPESTTWQTNPYMYKKKRNSQTKDC